MTEPAREIENSHVAEPAAAPHPVAYRGVDEDQPQGGKQKCGGERGGIKGLMGVVN